MQVHVQLHMAGCHCAAIDSGCCCGRCPPWSGVMSGLFFFVCLAVFVCGISSSEVSCAAMPSVCSCCTGAAAVLREVQPTATLPASIAGRSQLHHWIRTRSVNRGMWPRRLHHGGVEPARACTECKKQKQKQKKKGVLVLGRYGRRQTADAAGLPWYSGAGSCARGGAGGGRAGCRHSPSRGNPGLRGGQLSSRGRLCLCCSLPRPCQRRALRSASAGTTMSHCAAYYDGMQRGIVGDATATLRRRCGDVQQPMLVTFRRDVGMFPFQGSPAKKPNRTSRQTVGIGRGMPAHRGGHVPNRSRRREQRRGQNSAGAQGGGAASGRRARREGERAQRRHGPGLARAHIFSVHNSRAIPEYSAACCYLLRALPCMDDWFLSPDRLCSAREARVRCGRFQGSATALGGSRAPTPKAGRVCGGSDPKIMAGQDLHSGILISSRPARPSHSGMTVQILLPAAIHYLGAGLLMDPANSREVSQQGHWHVHAPEDSAQPTAARSPVSVSDSGIVRQWHHRRLACILCCRGPASGSELEHCVSRRNARQDARQVLQK